MYIIWKTALTYTSLIGVFSEKKMNVENWFFRIICLCYQYINVFYKPYCTKILLHHIFDDFLGKAWFFGFQSEPEKRRRWSIGTQVVNNLSFHWRLGTSSEGAQLRARMQSACLVSDMESFKAANPGCTIEDFVRWYSPRDWIEEDESTKENPTGMNMRAENECESIMQFKFFRYYIYEIRIKSIYQDNKERLNYLV